MPRHSPVPSSSELCPIELTGNIALKLGYVQSDNAGNLVRALTEVFMHKLYRLTKFAHLSVSAQEYDLPTACTVRGSAGHIAVW